MHEEVPAQTAIGLQVSTILWLITAILTQSGETKLQVTHQQSTFFTKSFCADLVYCSDDTVYTASQLISRLQLDAKILHLQRWMLAADPCQARASY